MLSSSVADFKIIKKKITKEKNSRLKKMKSIFKKYENHT